MACGYWTFCLLIETCIKFFLSSTKIAWPKCFFWTLLITTACTFILELLNKVRHSSWILIIQLIWCHRFLLSIQKSRSVWIFYLFLHSRIQYPKTRNLGLARRIDALSDTEGLQNKVKLSVWLTGFSMAKTARSPKTGAQNHPQV